MTCVGGPAHGQDYDVYNGHLAVPFEAPEPWREMHDPVHKRLPDARMASEQYEAHLVEVCFGSMKLTGWVMKWNRLDEKDLPATALGLLIGKALVIAKSGDRIREPRVGVHGHLPRLPQSRDPRPTPDARSMT